ncbi:PGF-pre-PGF domain-containing protein [Halarchaeum nitratireducens]|uniref:CARDB domain-containing protein n=1 Tax=Halarchaeum nitratireducens TaxID=489913 RepID=A0A830GE96_9EURY|nr:PGF-pre-PGF domain-containing protein [Halarchaeum nitratireducens]GGN22755.1 hypothetical protein GCM10009021_25430 [Halarchaeum nitratireducens]
MRHLAVAVFALFLAGTLAFPSLGAPLFAGGDHVSEHVSLAPADSPHGDYAYMRDGDLVVDLTASNPDVSGAGINPNAVTRFDRVFLIRHNGSEYADVWVTDDSPDVTFYARGHAIQSVGENVTLAPNGTVAVGFTVDTRDGATDGLIQDLTVHARVGGPSPSDGGDKGGNGGEGTSAPPTVQSTAGDDGTLDYAVNDAAVGESVTLDGSPLTVAQDGQGETVTLDGIDVNAQRSSFDLSVSRRDNSLRVGGRGVDELGAFGVDVADGATDGGRFQFSVSQAYLERADVSRDRFVVYHGADDDWRALETTVAGSRDGRVRFVAETDGFSPFVVGARVPAFAVSNASLATQSVPANESASVRATVRNEGAARGTESVALRVDGATVATRSVSLARDTMTTVTFTLNATPGEHRVAVGNTSAGTLSVGAVPSGTIAGTSESETTTTTSGTSTESTRTREAVAEPAAIEWRALSGLLGALVLVAGLLAAWRRWR